MDVLHLCCCCLRRAPARDLRAPYTHLGNTEIYQDMLKECFNIHFSEGAGGYGICEECAGRLRDASDFKIQVQQCQMELQAIEQDLLNLEVGDKAMEDCVLYEELFDSEVPGDAASEDCTSQALCGNWCPSQDGLGDHTYAKTECPQAAVPLNGAAGAGQGAELQQSETKQQLAMACSVRLERLRERARQTCLATSRRGPRLASRGTDMPGDTAGARAHQQYTCDTCGERFTGKSSLIAHIQGHAARVVGVSRSCDISHSKFIRVGTLIDYNLIEFPEKPFTCNICNKKFTQEYRLEAHIDTHMKHPCDKPYTCDICGESFVNRQHLIVHIRTHPEQNPYTCDICCKSFLYKSILMNHQRNHPDANRYPCDTCDKQFMHKNSLIRHLRTHTGEKPYVCDLCGRTFADGSTLRRHRLTHMEKIKPHTCDICSKRFAEKSGLVRHCRRHTEPKHTCDVCNKTFIDKVYLQRHLRIHAGKPYTCEKCGKQFQRRHVLNIHMTRHT